MLDMVDHTTYFATRGSALRGRSAIRPLDLGPVGRWVVESWSAFGLWHDDLVELML